MKTVVTVARLWLAVATVAVSSSAFINGHVTLRRLSTSSEFLTQEEFWFNQTVDHFSPCVLSKKFGAAIVSLEHRYYGRSSPFKSLTTNNLRYISSKQALFDN